MKSFKKCCKKLVAVAVSSAFMLGACAQNPQEAESLTQAGGVPPAVLEKSADGAKTAPSQAPAGVAEDSMVGFYRGSWSQGTYTGGVEILISFDEKGVIKGRSVFYEVGYPPRANRCSFYGEKKGNIVSISRKFIPETISSTGICVMSANLTKNGNSLYGENSFGSTFQLVKK